MRMFKNTKFICFYYKKFTITRCSNIFIEISCVLQRVVNLSLMWRLWLFIPSIALFICCIVQYVNHCTMCQFWIMIAIWLNLNVQFFFKYYHEKPQPITPIKMFFFRNHSYTEIFNVEVKSTLLYLWVLLYLGLQLHLFLLDEFFNVKIGVVDLSYNTTFNNAAWSYLFSLAFSH